jgi:hypothetical protein
MITNMTIRHNTAGKLYNEKEYLERISKVNIPPKRGRPYGSKNGSAIPSNLAWRKANPNPALVITKGEFIFYFD